MSDRDAEHQEMTGGFLGMELYVVTSTPAAPPEKMAENLKAPLAHQVAIEKKGILFAAGPLYGKTDQVPRAGMIIIRAASFEEADRIAASDPMHQAGARGYTIDKWCVNEGGFNLRVTYSDQKMEIS